MKCEIVPYHYLYGQAWSLIVYNWNFVNDEWEQCYAHHGIDLKRANEMKAELIRRLN